MYAKKKCGMCGKKGQTSGTRVVPGKGAVECCAGCKGFLDGPGDQANHNPARVKLAGPMGGRYTGPAPKPQRRR